MQYYEHIFVVMNCFFSNPLKSTFVFYFLYAFIRIDRLRTRNVVTPSKQFEVFSRTHIKAERRF